MVKRDEKPQNKKKKKLLPWATQAVHCLLVSALVETHLDSSFDTSGIREKQGWESLCYNFSSLKHFGQNDHDNLLKIRDFS